MTCMALRDDVGLTCRYRGNGRDKAGVPQETTHSSEFDFVSILTWRYREINGF